MVKLRKGIIAVLLGGFAAWVIVAVGVHIYYFESLPRTPDEGAGRTYRMVVNHGSVRYGSERELRALNVIEGAIPIPVFMFLAALALGLGYGHFQIRGRSRVNK